MKLSELKILPDRYIIAGWSAYTLWDEIKDLDITEALLKLIKEGNPELVELLRKAGWTRLPVTFPLGAVKLDEIIKEWIKENGYFKWSEVELDKLGFQALLDLTPLNSVDAEIIELVADNIQKLLKVKGGK